MFRGAGCNEGDIRKEEREKMSKLEDGRWERGHSRGRRKRLGYCREKNPKEGK